MRSRNAVGLATLILAAGACSSTPEGAKVAPVGSTSQALSTSAAVTASTSSSSGPLLDLGASDPTQVVTVSVVFQAKHLDRLEQLVQATGDPSSPMFQTFLSVPEFAAIFAPSKADIARVASYMTTFGVTPGATLSDQLVLKATGTVGAFTQAFTFTMNDFQDASGNVFHRPTSTPAVPRALSDVMLVVTGFSSQPAFVSMAKTASSIPGFSGKVVLPQAGSTATSTAGSYTVGDFANQYDVNPLYQRGIDGTGSTIGIATLGAFVPADAYDYWSAIGLTVGQSRITQVHVDDGAPAGRGSNGESALDVEQSGGVAPGANVIVYDAPNTDGGFLDLFYNAASDNLVDDLSVSWGGAEIYYEAALNGGVDFTGEMAAFHQVFLEAAAQGISVFVAAGDSGAYDSSGTSGLSNVLCVDAPGSDPAVTSAGGTTTPTTITGDLFGGSPNASYTIAQEQVWGWDWLQTFLNANDVADSSTWNEFSTGGGGGVSIYWPRPYYQDGVRGVRKTEGDQVLTQTGLPNYTLPAGFEGRNVPDLSADADPLSGYLLYVKRDGWQGYYGGTSFVAPQMNGVSALVRQRVGHRVGLWNPMLYRFAQRRDGDDRREGPIGDITAGDNWFYDGVRGYDPASGVGVLDVTRFADALARE